MRGGGGGGMYRWPRSTGGPAHAFGGCPGPRDGCRRPATPPTAGAALRLPRLAAQLTSGATAFASRLTTSAAAFTSRLTTLTPGRAPLLSGSLGLSLCDQRRTYRDHPSQCSRQSQQGKCSSTRHHLRAAHCQTPGLHHHVLHWTAVYSKKVRRPAMQKPVVGRVGLARARTRLGRRPPGCGRNELTHPPTTFDQPFRPRAPRPGLDEALGGGLGSSQKGALRSCPLEVMNWPFNGANRRVSGPQRQRKTFLGFPPGDPTVGQQRDVISPFRTRPPPAHWGRRLD